MLTINFLEDGNRYKAENFSVYLTFDGLPNDISSVYVVESFVISTCLSYVVIVCISEKSYFRSANISEKSSFSLKTKVSTGQLSCRAFQLSSEGAFLVDIPVDQFYSLKLQDMDSSSYSFMVMYDKRLGIRIK